MDGGSFAFSQHEQCGLSAISVLMARSSMHQSCPEEGGIGGRTLESTDGLRLSFRDGEGTVRERLERVCM